MNDPLTQLTEKQRAVLELVADNRTSKEIAGLLGISESAVNQRIEMVRARLGGIARGELARLYRQEMDRKRAISATFPPAWQKIHLPDPMPKVEETGTESIHAAGNREFRANPGSGGVDGSQLSQNRVPGGLSRLTRNHLARNHLARNHLVMAAVRTGVILLIMVCGMAIAAAVTAAVG